MRPHVAMLALRLTLKNIIVKDNPIPPLKTDPSYLWASVRSSINYFRGSIEWASAKGLQKLVFVIKVGESKISNLQIELHKASVVLTICNRKSSARKDLAVFDPAVGQGSQCR